MPARAQDLTTTSATVVDSAGTAYTFGTYTASLVNNTGQPALLGGNANFQKTYQGGLDTNGFFSLVLPSVSVMTPSGMQWSFFICANPQAIAYEFPKPNLPCFTYTSTGTQISGASVDLSASMTAVAATIPKSPTTNQSNTWTSPQTFTGTATFTGPLNCKTFESTVCVDAANTQGWAGSEFAAWVNSAIASLPLVNDPISGNNYRSGTVWMAANGAIAQTVAIIISSPFLSIIGPGRGALRLNCNINGDCIRWNTSPFTTVPAALLQGFSIFNTSGGANSVGIHAGDMLKPKLYDVVVSSFNGTNGIGLWWDNVTNYTEQIDMQSVTLDSSKTNLKYTNSNGATNSQSFGYGHYRNVVILPSPGQTGVWSASVAGTNPIVLYHSVVNWNIENNTSGGTNTFLRIDAGSSWQDNIYQIVMEENAANGGTMLQLGNNVALTGSGSIVTGSTFCGTKTDTLGTGLVINVQQITFCGPDQTPAWVSLGGGGGLNGQPHFYNPFPATVTVSQPSAPIGIWGNYWTGAATAVDKWFVTHTLGTGANPSSFLKLNHSSGSSGLAAVEVPSLIIDSASASTRLIFSGAGFQNATFLDSSGTVAYNPPAALGVDLGSASLPWANLWLGTAATNNFKFQPAATAAARTINIADPGANANLALDASSTYVPSTNVFTGAWVCTNVTPVTLPGTSTTADQNLMACTIPAGTLNRVGRTLRVKVAGIYSTPAASTSQVTLKVKICSVSGCGSGNVLTALNIQSTAIGTVQITNDNFSLRGELTTQTAGAALAEEAHGEYLIDLATLATAADSVFGDGNTATQTGTPSAIDSTAQNFLQVTIAFSVASASNVATQRQLIAETVN